MKKIMEKIKIKWVVLGIIGLIIYLNIGYLVNYSLDIATKPTVISEIIYNIIDFGTISHKGSLTTRDYIIGSLIWPIFVVLSWFVNSIVLLYKVLVWLCIFLFTGGFWRWLGLIM